MKLFSERFLLILSNLYKNQRFILKQNSFTKALRVIESTFKSFLTFLFPDCCIICSSKEELAEYGMCKPCRNKVHLLKNHLHCYCCGRKMKTSNLCITCAASKPKFDEAKAVFVYNAYVSVFIQKIKFHDRTFIAKSLAKIILRHFKEDLEKCDFIIPVPIHRVRLLQRQYNQSALIAMQLAKLIHVKVRLDILHKIKNTPPQLNLSTYRRKTNLQDAFRIGNHAALKDASIILLDDVITTGATVSCCAEALLQYNPRKIIVIAIARSILR
ncbi:ComF family protein [Neorickettsia findlayensis]|uniref:ComF family protein n=1 Tax=Neorickettsia findlayensis TaxID=2686014 RepID=A0A6P1GB86_9RICK|nr:ComF family protein [Neorickettsia findlayensis]QHD65161.1 ComF family protein [Neorickettsia findlayensis]